MPDQPVTAAAAVLPTPDDERAVHLAILADELWSPSCVPAWKWDVPLAYQAEQVTCPTCRREAVKRGRE